MRDLLKSSRKQELVVYVVIWLLLFTLPMVVLQFHHSEDDIFPWGELVSIWQEFALFFVLFLLHNYLIAPLLVYKRRPTLYFSSVVVLLVCFMVLQCVKRPEMPQDRPPHGMMEHRPPMMHDERDDDFKHEPPPIILGQHDLVAAIVFVLMLGMNLGVKLYFRQRDDERRMADLERKNLEQQLEFLRYQINPHFLMNTLNNIHALGWCPFRSGADLHEKNVNVGAGDGNEPNWSGALICHKLIQHADGTLTLGAVPAMAAKYNQEQPLTVMASNGATLSGIDGGATLSGDDAYVLYNRLGTCNHITFTVKTSNNWDKFGISFVRGTDSKKYYTIVVNPEDENHRKVNFEQEGEEGKGFIEAADGYWFERPADNIYSIDIYTDNSVLVMYVRSTSGRSQGENDVCTYTQRIYGIQKNCWSVNNYGGSVTVSDVHVSQQ